MKPHFVNVPMRAAACMILLALSLAVGNTAFSADPTVLHMDFRDEQGQTVKVSEATLVLVVGNYIDKLPLKVTPDGLDLPMDTAWLKAHWPGGKDRIKNLDRTFLFLQAPGYAHLSSNEIQWLGTKADGPKDSATVSFPRSKVQVVARGQTSTLEVKFRRPVERYVKLTAGEGVPIVGAKVKTYVYWSKTEDGNLNGAGFLGEGISDKTGRVSVADGDFVYAIQVSYKASAGKPARTVLVLKRFADKEYPVSLP